jgi:hypothetical protein
MLKTAKKIILANQINWIYLSLCKISWLLLRSSGTLFLTKKAPANFTHKLNKFNYNWFAKIIFLAVFNIPSKKIRLQNENAFFKILNVNLVLKASKGIWRKDLEEIQTKKKFFFWTNPENRNNFLFAHPGRFTVNKITILTWKMRINLSAAF